MPTAEWLDKRNQRRLAAGERVIAAGTSAKVQSRYAGSKNGEMQHKVGMEFNKPVSQLGGGSPAVMIQRILVSPRPTATR